LKDKQRATGAGAALVAFASIVFCKKKSELRVDVLGLLMEEKRRTKI
jgi:hypothetical protein